MTLTRVPHNGGGATGRSLVSRLWGWVRGEGVSAPHVDMYMYMYMPVRVRKCAGMYMYMYVNESPYTISK